MIYYPQTLLDIERELIISLDVSKLKRKLIRESQEAKVIEACKTSYRSILNDAGIVLNTENKPRNYFIRDPFAK